MKECVKCLMNETDPEILFNESGVCSHCELYDYRAERLATAKANFDLDKFILKMKSRARRYDCILGVSGGVDSSYLVLWAKRNGLNPLCIHLDNGWNSELAVHNINRLIDYSGFDLITHVISWREFKSIQRAFFKADVIDIELVTDQAIFASLHKYARKHKIKYILSGENFSTENILPRSWVWRKTDVRNIMSINSLHGDVPNSKLKTYPKLGTIKKTFYQYTGLVISFPILNYLNYSKESAIQELVEIGWKPYPGKHFESVFTRFYQGVILPQKFNVDKRIAHLSSLIVSGQIDRNKALRILEENEYSKSMQTQDFDLVCKKLGFSNNELAQYLLLPSKDHLEYDSDERIFKIMYKLYGIFNLRRFNKYV